MAPPATPADTGYSPPISIDLTLHGHRHEVASVGPDRLYLRDPAQSPPGVGVVRMTVDGRPTFYHVDLFAGLNPTTARQDFKLLGKPANVVA